MKIKSARMAVFLSWVGILWSVVGVGLASASWSGYPIEITPNAKGTPEAEVLSDLELIQRLPPASSNGTVQNAPLLTSNTLSSYIIYDDATLSSGWMDWSWNVDRDLQQTQVVQNGQSAIRLSYRGAWGGFYLHVLRAVPVQTPACLRFWAHGGVNGQQKLSVVVNRERQTVVALQPNSWVFTEVPLEGSGNRFVIEDLVFQEYAGKPDRPFYLDDIILGSCGSGLPTPTPTPLPLPTPIPSPTPQITPEVFLHVDVTQDQHPINPHIYGMNFADERLARDLRLPIRRWGGNATTRYNWQFDVSNRGSDWFFENIANEHPVPGLLPAGSSVERFVQQDRRTGTDTILTLSMIGWTPKLRENDCAFRVSKYGAQQRVDPWHPDCGNGVNLAGDPITGNDPEDANKRANSNFARQWIQRLHRAFGTASNGGVRFYNLDNEPMLWNITHRDVHPDPVGYDELYTRTVEYAGAIKEEDPAAQVLGPVAWGWTDYFYSALDMAPGGQWWLSPQDYVAHGRVPLVEWYLRKLRVYEQEHEVRLLDYLDLHFYPQAAGVALAPAGDALTQALRLRSTRALWDPTYQDESWIAQPVQLIPRMKGWVNANYPGTKLALSEYNWGALDDLNGALAQADILGIFGREGLDMALLWAPPEFEQPGAYAFRMYRNYNGTGGAFGETSVRADSSRVDDLTIYAARRAGDRALTVMVINKSPRDLSAALTITGMSGAGYARVYRYSRTNLNAILQEADRAFGSSGLLGGFPAYSITLLVIPAAP